MKTIRSYSVTLGLVLSACLVLAVSWCVMAVPSPALGKPPSGKVSGKRQQIDVAVMFRNHPDDRYQSDGLGAYVSFKDGKVRAKVFIGLGGQLRMGTGTRWTNLDFRDAFFDECLPFVEGQGAGFSTGQVDESDDGKLTDDEPRANLTLMTPDSSMRIGLTCLFAFDGVGYQVQFGDQNGLTDLVTVVGGPDDNGDGFSDSWVIEAGTLDVAAVYTTESEESRATPCNFVLMPFAVLVVKD